MFSISKSPTIQEIHELYKNKKATPTQVTTFFLNRIRETEKDLTAFASFDEEKIQARGVYLEEILEEAIKLGADSWFEELVHEYPLFGIPYSLKSIVLASGDEFHASSNILKGYKAPYSSTVYKRLDKSGGIFMGVNYNDQFAVGSSGETCDFDIPKNPYDITRVAGGSSTGGAVSVASGQVVFSICTDTGGSIRQPAAFTNTVGLKPTYGLVSRYGVMPMASSLDQPAAITNNTKDNILVTTVIMGQDKMDQTSLNSEDLEKRLKQVLLAEKHGKKYKIGLPKEFYIDGIHPQINSKIKKLQIALEDSGHELVDVSIPLIKYAVSVYYLIMPVEFASNLERIDGVRFATQEEDYPDMYFEHRSYFGDEPKRRIMLGTYISSAGYYDAYYNKAQKVREMARKSFEEVLGEVDLLLTPTTPEFPFKFGTKTSDPLKMYLSDVFTCGINPVRIPSLNIPLGLFDVETEDGVKKLPTGCQIMGSEMQEDKLFDLAIQIESLNQKNKF